MIEELLHAAEAAGVTVEPLPEGTGYLGVFVRDDLPGGQEVWVVRKAYGWRILETHDTYTCGYGRYWCYPGGSPDSFATAVKHAALYGDGEPDGWIKAWNGRTAHPPRTRKAP